MQKIVLVFGRSVSRQFQTYIHDIDSSIQIIECDYSFNSNSAPEDRRLELPVGKEFATIKKFLANKQLVAVINRKDSLEKLHGQVVDYYNIPGPSERAVDQISNKANFHELMLDLDLSMFRPRTIICQLSEAPRLLKSSQFPVIIKPFAGAHSRGVYKLESINEFESVYQQLYKHFNPPHLNPRP
ncbi:MAG: hypothetical protein COU67_01600 [Candidatus Pacebacteria bacterium CG10_big_fil_rev_8_21_14_0_10_44_54]|nr:MAG: hypothetical protein COU67_01600 [Candidatus Pacebacteria bacterium CG10_big_fil_rev_8_21_14_0_10_44_54]